MAAIFAGKFQYYTAVEVVPRAFLTVVPGDDEPTLQFDFSYPEPYKPLPVIIYKQPDDTFLAAMAVPDPSTNAIAVGYFALPQPGALTIDSAVGNAVALCIDPLGAEPSTWRVLSPQDKTWHQVYYTQDWYGDQGKLWCDPTPTPSTPIEIFRCYCVTPGYATLANTKQGRKADLAYTDLSGLDFTGVDFYRGRFYRCGADRHDFSRRHP